MPADDLRALQQFYHDADRHRAALVLHRAVLLASEFAELLGIDAAALNHAVAGGRIFTLDVAGKTYYPAWYGDRQYSRRQVERICYELRALPGWSQWQFFTTPKESLRRMTPLQALRRGEFNAVCRAARGFAER
ncbi:MAG TPA: hypothetical protein VFA81_01840 [Burkholderiales bacterium]|nr:hypothetical protein [Burkholderiales bacterium]